MHAEIIMVLVPAEYLYIILFHLSGPQVNTNGILSFRVPFTDFTPRMFPLPDNVPVIAPFWDNVDIERFGNISYRETTESTIRQKADAQLKELFPSAGSFTSTRLFIATWDRVAEFEGGSQVSCLLVNDHNTWWFLV